MKALLGATLLVCVVTLVACSSPSAKTANAAADAWGDLQVSVNRTIKNNSSAIDADFREWKGMATLCAQAKAAVFQAGGCAPADCTNRYNTVRNRMGRVREAYDRLAKTSRTPELIEQQRSLLETAESLTADFLKTEPAGQ